MFDDVDEMVQDIRRKDAEYGLCRTVAGYAWDWKTKGRIEPTNLKETEECIKNGFWDIEIDGHKYIWNVHFDGWVGTSNSVNEIGCIHTIQGFDLNYAGVIIGNELKYDPETDKIYVDVATTVTENDNFFNERIDFTAAGIPSEGFTYTMKGDSALSLYLGNPTDAGVQVIEAAFNMRYDDLKAVGGGEVPEEVLLAFDAMQMHISLVMKNNNEGTGGEALLTIDTPDEKGDVTATLSYKDVELKSNVELEAKIIEKQDVIMEKVFEASEALFEYFNSNTLFDDASGLVDNLIYSDTVVKLDTELLGVEAYVVINTDSIYYGYESEIRLKIGTYNADGAYFYIGDDGKLTLITGQN
jgi:DUF2075 family protein